MLRGIPVLTVSDVDKVAPFTSGAQELIHLGENPRAYLEIDRILKFAKARGVAAIHPGWGFASEDYSFPEKCEDAGTAVVTSVKKNQTRKFRPAPLNTIEA